MHSAVQFPAVHWTGDDLWWFSESQVLHSRGTLSRIGQSAQRLSLDENWQRMATAVTGSRLSRAGSMHSGNLNSTQLNWTIQLSSVQFSIVHWALTDTECICADLNNEHTRPSCHKDKLNWYCSSKNMVSICKLNSIKMSALKYSSIHWLFFQSNHDAT